MKYEDAFPFASDVGGTYTFPVEGHSVTCLIYQRALLAMIKDKSHKGHGEVCIVPLDKVTLPHLHPLDTIAAQLAPFARLTQAKPQRASNLMSVVAAGHKTLEEAIRQADFEEDAE